METPEYGSALRLIDDCRYYPPFFASPETAPKDWAFVNNNGVFTFPKIVFETRKKVAIIIKVGYYFGLYDSGFTIQAYSGGGCSSPAMATTAERKQCQSESLAIIDAVKQAFHYLRTCKLDKTDEFKEFSLWAKDYEKPLPKQLDLFATAT